jgi:uncharacterized membrane protein YhaH (DUF805 family)
MDFMTAVKTVFSKYADFKGRARRSEYWYFALFNFICALALGFVDAAMNRDNPDKIGILSLVYNLAVLVPSIAVAVRRMHDVGKSGWFVLIPIYNLILACTNSQPGDNEYGPNPKTGISEDDIESLGQNQ